MREYQPPGVAPPLDPSPLDDCSIWTIYFSCTLPINRWVRHPNSTIASEYQPLRLPVTWAWKFQSRSLKIQNLIKSSKKSCFESVNEKRWSRALKNRATTQVASMLISYNCTVEKTPGILDWACRDPNHGPSKSLDVSLFWLLLEEYYKVDEAILTIPSNSMQLRCF